MSDSALPKTEGEANAKITSSPIEIPNKNCTGDDKRQRNRLRLELPEDDRSSQDKTGSFHSDDDFPHLPDGSPSFAVVMNELSSSLTRTIRPEFTISPLALESQNPFDEVSSEADTPETKSPPQVESPLAKKKLQKPKEHIRDRSHSWNHRNKMAAERRKLLSVPHSVETNSARSSPVTTRKQKKAKSQPGTPKIFHFYPKFKILDQSVSVSHEDLVKEQEKERRLEEGFNEVKSIFDAPKFDRTGATPE